MAFVERFNYIPANLKTEEDVLEYIGTEKSYARLFVKEYCAFIASNDILERIEQKGTKASKAASRKRVK